MIIYQIGYFLGGWVGGCIIKISSRRCVFTGAAVARSTKAVETPKHHKKFPLWVGLFRGKDLVQQNFANSTVPHFP